MEARIVPISPEHIESFHGALDVVAHERKYLTLLEAPPLSQMREFVLNGIQKGDPQFVVLAEGAVVGWCDIRRHYFPTHEHRGTLGMGIIPPYRVLGYGPRLLKAALDNARTAGFVRIEFSVHSDNRRAIALYERAGFVREGIVRDAVFIDGEYRDSIAMALVDRQNAG